MARDRYDYLIIGGGLAAASAVKELVLLEPGASIGIIAAETIPPYDHPPLSKEYLLGLEPRESLFLLKDSTYKRYGIEVHLGMAATGLDPEAGLVKAGAAGFAFGKLLIASGCALRRLRVPGADLPGLYYLRTLADCEAIRDAAASSRSAVVIGGSFIGLEVASVLSQLNISTTVIHQGKRLLEPFASEEISSYFEQRFLDEDVHIVYEDEAVELLGEGSVESVVTRSGRILPGGMICAGIGVFPDTAYLEGSGLELDNGIVVNEYLEAAPGIFAAGDVAGFSDTIYGRRRRIEHWDNAIHQGITAARNMAGRREAYHHVSYFYSTMFGLTYEFFGDLAGFDEAILRGSFARKSAAVLYLSNGALIAAFLFNRPPAERDAVQRLIAAGTDLGGVRDNLAESGFPLASIGRTDRA